MATAILRSRSRLFSSAPPPSPIATAKGSKSAAINDQILTEFLEKSAKIPDLTLPESQFSDRFPRRIPAEIQLPPLLSREEDSVRHLFESIADLGAFQITGHDISANEIVSLIGVFDRIFQVPNKKKQKLSRSFRQRGGIREDFYWCSEKESVVTLSEEIGSDTYRTFSENMEAIFMKMQSIAEEVGQILSEHMRKMHRRIIPKTESVLCLHKYNQCNLEGNSSDTQMQVQNDEDSSHAFRLHISGDDHQFCIPSRKGPVSFNVGAGTIVLTAGKRLQEWSQGDLDHVIAEPIFEPGIDADQSFTIEFMSSPSSLRGNLDQVAKTITLIDQMLITLLIVLLYKFLTFLSSKFYKI